MVVQILSWLAGPSVAWEEGSSKGHGYGYTVLQAQTYSG